ncbi:hypothetical protein ILYODFUR_033013 [Ilyodon furcidens]|uniref:Uncharacterized protein n=1 Tax=Ilyodon furcidens TaxID=33524 RepID=A0ABV0V844_9TELE
MFLQSSEMVRIKDVFPPGIRSWWCSGGLRGFGRSLEARWWRWGEGRSKFMVMHSGNDRAKSWMEGRSSA